MQSLRDLGPNTQTPVETRNEKQADMDRVLTGHERTEGLKAVISETETSLP